MSIIQTRMKLPPFSFLSLIHWHAYLESAQPKGIMLLNLDSFYDEDEVEEDCRCTFSSSDISTLEKVPSITNLLRAEVKEMMTH